MNAVLFYTIAVFVGGILGCFITMGVVEWVDESHADTFPVVKSQEPKPKKKYTRRKKK